MRPATIVLAAALASISTDVAIAQGGARDSVDSRAVALHGNASSSPRIMLDSAQKRLVASAEAEGAARERKTPARKPHLFANARGSAERKCEAGYGVGPVRSGDFVIGGLLGSDIAPAAGAPRKVWWAPLNQSADMRPLHVQGRNLSAPADTFRFTTSKLAWPTGDSGKPLAERDHFFPSGIVLPHAGTWLLVATSGSNWGCFILRAE